MLRSFIRQAVTEAIFDAKKPVACVLSGGIDSSTIVALAGNVPTFTGYYDEPGFDERQYSRLVGRGHHYEIKITPDDFVDNFDEMMRWLKPPWQGMGAFGQFMVGKAMGKLHYRTALSGEGADELFGGYARLMHVAGLAMPEGYDGYKEPLDYPSDVKDALQYDWDRLPDLLAVDDQCMKAHGIHAVAPFMDNRLVTYVLQLPPEQRVGKKLLRNAVRGLVPDVIINRRDKMGFPCPLVKWCQEDPVRSFVESRIGFIPEPDQPWDRHWWYELLNSSNLATVNEG